MEILRQRIKTMRTDLSEILVVCAVEGHENPDNSLDQAQVCLMSAFMMLGKCLAFVGEPNPYDGREVTDIADFSKLEYDPSGTIGIHVVRKQRDVLQNCIASSVFNHLLDHSTSENTVKYNDRLWFFTMTALTDIMKAKHWLGMYLRHLYLDESEEQKQERYAVEAKEQEPMTDADPVMKSSELSIADMKAFLRGKGVKFNNNLGDKKVRALYNDSK